MATGSHHESPALGKRWRLNCPTVGNLWVQHSCSGKQLASSPKINLFHESAAETGQFYLGWIFLANTETEFRIFFLLGTMGFQLSLALKKLPELWLHLEKVNVNLNWGSWRWNHINGQFFLSFRLIRNSDVCSDKRAGVLSWMSRFCC